MKKFLSIFIAVLIMVCSSVCIMAEETYKIGDANKDGKININDVTSIQLYLVKLYKNGELSVGADVDGSGKITIRDATFIQLYIVKHIDRFPCEPETVPSTDSDGYYDQIVKP